jgi:phosphoserine phosphatase
MRSPDLAPVLIFDLDGTLLRCNSFPHWVLFLTIGRLPGLGPRRRMALSLRVIRLMLRRKIGWMHHDELQRRLQVAWQAATADGGKARTDRFEATLVRQLRPNVRSCLDLVAERQLDAVLATAAAADYAEALGRRLGFRHVLATRSGRLAGEPANAGAAKRQKVADFLCDIGWCKRQRILFTDHIDDVPLIRDCNVVCWFGSADSMSAVQAMVGETRFIRCREMSEAHMLATFRTLCDYSATPGVARRACSLSEITVS